MFGIGHSGGSVDPISHVLMESVERGSAHQRMFEINPVMTDLDESGGPHLVKSRICDSKMAKRRREDMHWRTESCGGSGDTALVGQRHYASFEPVHNCVTYRYRNWKR